MCLFPDILILGWSIGSLFLTNSYKNSQVSDRFYLYFYDLGLYIFDSQLIGQCDFWWPHFISGIIRDAVIFEFFLVLIVYGIILKIQLIRSTFGEVVLKDWKKCFLWSSSYDQANQKWKLRGKYSCQISGIYCHDYVGEKVTLFRLSNINGQ